MQSPTISSYFNFCLSGSSLVLKSTSILINGVLESDIARYTAASRAMPTVVFSNLTLFFKSLFLDEGWSRESYGKLGSWRECNPLLKVIQSVSDSLFCINYKCLLTLSCTGFYCLIFRWLISQLLIGRSSIFFPWKILKNSI